MTTKLSCNTPVYIIIGDRPLDGQVNKPATNLEERAQLFHCLGFSGQADSQGFIVSLLKGSVDT